LILKAHRYVSFFLLILLTLSACVGSPSHKAINASTGNNTMTVTNSELNSNDAKLNAEEVSLRVLKLLDGLKSNSDLTREHILETTGWSLSAQLDDPKYSVFGEAISSDWGYGLQLFPNPSNAKKKQALF
jgi:hypothetical protein